MPDELPGYSLYRERDWAQELGRPLTPADRLRLAAPGGEAAMIAELAAAGHPVTLYSPYIPGEGNRANPFWHLPVHRASGEPVSYTLLMGGVHYYVEGRWFDGHGQFVAHDARWRLGHEDTWGMGHPVTSLKLKVLAVAIEMRAGAIIGQTVWLRQIAKMNPSDRQVALAELHVQGESFVDVELCRGDGGSGGVNFRGLAGLGAYHLEWHRDGGSLVVDRVFRPAQSAQTLHAPYREIPARRRRRLRADWRRDRVIIELVTLAVARRRALASV